MKNLLFIGSWERDIRELERSGVNHRYNVLLDPISQQWAKTLTKPGSLRMLDLQQELDQYIQYYADKAIDGIVAPHDYPSCIVGSIVAQVLELPGPHPDAVLRSQHKYYSRLDQQQYAPEAVPRFQVLDPRNIRINSSEIVYPAIVKPVKSSFSIHTFKVNSLSELQTVIPQAAFPDDMLAPFNFFLQRFSSCKLDAQHLLVEECASGIQCTLEGYVCNGEVGLLGVVDSIMYPGTLSFERFQYPSVLPESIQQRMEDIATRILRGINFDNALFNIEYMYDPETDRISIIEINPRMASQFADLYERVDGTNSYQTLCDISAGVRPHATKRRGDFACAASCVLRTFQNHTVLNVPSPDDCARVMDQYPDARIELYAHPGTTLADELLQDGKSYRYALIHLGGADVDDILARLAWCKEQLPFDMVPCT